MSHEDILNYVDSVAMEDSLRSNWRRAVGLSLCARRAATFQAGNVTAISEILDRVIALLKRPLVRIPVDEIPLGRQFSTELSELREVWKKKSETPEDVAEIQKLFSDGSADLVFDILQDSAKLLGEPPGNFAVLLLGSSSRQDRLPFSDIELALLYSAESGNMIQMRVYAYVLMSIFDFSVLKLREDNIGGSRRHGFYIDGSEHLLLVPNILMGTVDDIYKRSIENPWTTSPGFLVLFEDMDGKAEFFTSFLSALLVNKNSWGGAALFSEFKAKVRNILDSKSDKWTQDALKCAFDSEGKSPRMIVEKSRVFQPCVVNIGSTPHGVSNTVLLNRQLIALYCWMDILRKAVDTSVGTSDVFSVKDACHKPLAYLALNLRLFLDTNTVCAIEVFGEASKRGILPFPVTKLLQEMYFLSVSWRSRLHLEVGGQEEEINISELSAGDRWAFLMIAEVLHKPLLEALKKVLLSEEDYSKNTTWDFILRDIFSSVWIHYCSKRDGWRENFSRHRLISQFEDFPSPSGLRPAIDTWREKKQKILRSFLLPRNDKIFSTNPGLVVEVRFWSRGKLAESRLHPEAVRQLQASGFLSKSGDLVFSQEQVEKEKGRHLVMPLSLPLYTSESSGPPEIFALYIKIFPEMPVLEIAVTEFATHLVGPCLPWVCLVKILVGGRSYPALLSEGIPGSLISKTHPPSLDPHFFSLRVLLAVLLNQEDAKPSNIVCLPSPKIPGSFVLVSIDNDRSFYEALQVDDAQQTLTPQVKDITFCFDEMYSPISPLAREFFLTLEPYNFLATWLRNSNSETLGLDTDLFSDSDKKAYFPQSGIYRQLTRFGRFLTQVAVPEESVLTLLLPSGLIGILYSKMTKLRQALIMNPQATHLDLLSVTEPHLAKYYRKILTFNGTAYDRFYRGFGYLYGSHDTKECVTVSTTFRTLESLHGKAVYLENVSETGQQIEKCFSELEEIHKIEVIWRSVLAGFRSNPETFQISLQLFRNLPSDFQERVINNLDFSQIMGRPLQAALLQELILKSDFRNLRFRSSEILTDALLERFLRRARQLQALSIVRCESISPRVLDILPLCPNLEKLFLSRLEWAELTVGTQSPRSSFWRFQIPDTSPVDDPWINLKVLVLKDLPNLRALALPLVSLEYLHIFSCPRLEEISLKNSSNLRSLMLLGCTGLDVKRLRDFIRGCIYLEKLILPDLETLRSLGELIDPANFPKFVSRLNLLPPFSSLSHSEKYEFLELFSGCCSSRKNSESLEVALFAAEHASAKKLENFTKVIENASQHDLRGLRNGYAQLLKTPDPDIMQRSPFRTYKEYLERLFENSGDRESLISLATELTGFSDFSESGDCRMLSRKVISKLLAFFGGPYKQIPGSRVLPQSALAKVLPSSIFPPRCPATPSCPAPLLG
jgi:hypothetical protein